MARQRSAIGRSGEAITLTTRFYVNGVLFDPHSILSVQILDPNGNVLSTPTPTQVSTGVYQVVWNIPAGTVAAIYSDSWVWRAQADMATQTRIYTFRVNNGLSGPDILKSSGDAPLFVNNQEISFFNGIAKELIQRIVGQKVIYYSISQEHTKVDDLYNEAIRKTVWRPVEINALVLFDTPTQTNTGFGIDTIYRIEIYFHKFELTERKVLPREGDFVKFGEVMYEIESLTEPQIVYGQIENKVMTKAVCRVSRETQFDIKD